MKKVAVICFCLLIMSGVALTSCGSPDNPLELSEQTRSDTAQNPNQQPVMDFVGYERVNNYYFSYFRNTMTDVMYTATKGNGVTNLETMLNADNSPVTYQQWLEFYGE